MPNRYICDVFEEMRAATKTKNFSYIEGLIEEAQSMANRMERALWDQNDYKRKMKEIKQLEKQIEKLKEKVGDGE